MVFLLEKEDYFRWFDSGDIQDEKMLMDIIKVCEATPNCKHWLPTREISIVKKVLSKTQIPENLNIRISSNFIGKEPIIKIEGCTYSTVGCGDDIEKTDCIVTKKENAFKKCLEVKCTNCWNKNVNTVNYSLH
jgi:hypothetical protein